MDTTSILENIKKETDGVGTPEMKTLVCLACHKTVGWKVGSPLPKGCGFCGLADAKFTVGTVGAAPTTPA